MVMVILSPFPCGGFYIPENVNASFSKSILFSEAALKHNQPDESVSNLHKSGGVILLHALMCLQYLVCR